MPGTVRSTGRYQSIPECVLNKTPLKPVAWRSVGVIAVEGASGDAPTAVRLFCPARHRNETHMTNFAASGDVQIDRTHNTAIRREIGDRLRMALNAERLPLTPHLFSLLDRLAAQDRRDPRSQQQG
jgi:hypothetical protein